MSAPTTIHNHNPAPLPGCVFLGKCDKSLSRGTASRTCQTIPPGSRKTAAPAARCRVFRGHPIHWHTLKTASGTPGTRTAPAVPSGPLPGGPGTPGTLAPPARWHPRPVPAGQRSPMVPRSCQLNFPVNTLQPIALCPILLLSTGFSRD
jgi:hypothetical protein